MISANGTKNRERRGAGAAVVFCLGKRDAGIDQSLHGRTVHRDGVDRQPMLLIEGRDPGHQRIEGRRFELDAHTAAARLRAAQGAAKTGLASHPVHQHHRRLSGFRRQRCAACLHLRPVQANPLQVRGARVPRLDGAGHRRFQRQHDRAEQEQRAKRDPTDGDDPLFAPLQVAEPKREPVHRRALAPCARICMWASTPTVDGVEDWISALKPCLPTNREICEISPRLGAVSFTSSESSR